MANIEEVEKGKIGKQPFGRPNPISLGLRVDDNWVAISWTLC